MRKKVEEVDEDPGREKTEPIGEVATLLLEWLDSKRRELSHTTIRDYESAIHHHLIPAFGSMELANLTPGRIRAWRGRLTCGNKRANNVLVPLKGLLREAWEDGLLRVDVAGRIRTLRVQHEEPRPFTPEEIRSILDVAEDPPLANLIQFATWTGLRTGELLALEWNQVDLERGQVRVVASLSRGRTKGPKTSAGERTLRLLQPAKVAILEQARLTRLRGGRVWTNPRTGEPWEDDQRIRRQWEPLLRRAGVEYRSPYHLRHTFASWMLSAGENPMWVAAAMGHSDWGMIRRVYGRWIAEVDPGAGQRAVAAWNTTPLAQQAQK